MTDMIRIVSLQEFRVTGMEIRSMPSIGHDHFVAMKMNAIQWNESIYFWLILINYDLSKSVSKTVLEVYNYIK